MLNAEGIAHVGVERGLRPEDVPPRGGADGGGCGAIRGRDAGIAHQKPLPEGRTAADASF